MVNMVVRYKCKVQFVFIERKTLVVNLVNINKIYLSFIVNFCNLFLEKATVNDKTNSNAIRKFCKCKEPVTASFNVWISTKNRFLNPIKKPPIVVVNCTAANKYISLKIVHINILSL